MRTWLGLIRYICRRPVWSVDCLLVGRLLPLTRGPVLGSDALGILPSDMGRKRDTKAQRGSSFLWCHTAS